MFDFFQDDPKAPAAPAEVTAARMTMAQSFGSMMLKAYDALLHYGVNFRDGSAYKDETLLDDAKKAPLARSVQLYVKWMANIESDIRALIARKSFKKVT